MSEETEAKKGPGRPDNTTARDHSVHAFVAGSAHEGVTRKQVVAKLQAEEEGISPSQGYLTLNRLKAAGRVERKFANGEHRWFATGA